MSERERERERERDFCNQNVKNDYLSTVARWSGKVAWFYLDYPKLFPKFIPYLLPLT